MVILAALSLCLFPQQQVIPDNNQYGVWRLGEDLLVWTRTRGTFTKDGQFGYMFNWEKQPGGDWVSSWIMSSCKSDVEWQYSNGLYEMKNLLRYGITNVTASIPDDFRTHSLIPTTPTSFGDLVVRWGLIGGSGYARVGRVALESLNHPPLFAGTMVYLCDIASIHVEGKYAGTNVSMEVEEAKATPTSFAVTGTMSLPKAPGLVLTGVRIGAQTVFELFDRNTNANVGLGVYDWNPTHDQFSGLEDGSAAPSKRITLSVHSPLSGPPTGYQAILTKAP